MSTNLKLWGLCLAALFAFAQPTMAQDETKERPAEEKKAEAGKEVDAKTFLNGLVKKYSAFKSYTATVKGTMDLGMMKLNQTATIKFKAKNKIHCTSKSITPMGNQNVEVYSDGTKAFMYMDMGPMKRYNKVEPDSEQLLQAEPFIMALLLNKLNFLEREGATIKVHEVKMGEATGHRVSIKQVSPQGKISFTYNLDKDGHLKSGKQVIELTGENANPMMPKKIVRTMEVSGIKTGEEYKDSEFEFTPPEGAVEAEGMPGMGGGMPGMGGKRRGPRKAPEEPKDDAEDF